LSISRFLETENSICDFSILEGDEAVCCFGLGSGERTRASVVSSDVATGYGGQAPRCSSGEVMEYISILPWIEELSDIVNKSPGPTSKLGRASKTTSKPLEYRDNIETRMSIEKASTTSTHAE
jgi:hypothetical protein